MKFQRTGQIAKVDEDQRLVFGWASAATQGDEAVVDSQRDTIETAELEKAAYDFVLRARIGGDMHERVGVGILVESMVFSKEKQDALGIDLGFEAWWVGFYIPDDEIWNLIKQGQRPMFSIGGVANREEIADESAEEPAEEG